MKRMKGKQYRKKCREVYFCIAHALSGVEWSSISSRFNFSEMKKKKKKKKGKRKLAGICVESICARYESNIANIYRGNIFSPISETIVSSS